MFNKLLVMIILMLSLSSCAIFQQDEESFEYAPDSQSDRPNFMDFNQVVASFKNVNKAKSFMIEELTSAGVGKLENSTIDIDKFFPSELLIGIKSRKILKSMDAIPTMYKGKGYVDLRNRDTYVVSQWNGTCSAHGLVAAIENAAGNKKKLSERHVWSGYKKYSANAAINEWLNGDCITLNEAWRHNRTIPNKTLTYKTNNYCFTYLKGVTYLEDNIQLAINALDLGRPIYIALQTTRSMLNCDSTLFPSSQATKGGHALAVVGYALSSDVAGGGYFIVKNSWGSGCHDKGFFYMSFYQVLRNDLYTMLWSIDQVALK